MTDPRRAHVVSAPSNIRHITPKTLTRTYKKHKYTVTFIPATKTWKWSVEIVTTMRFSEEADTQIKAFRAAEKLIDRSCK